MSSSEEFNEMDQDEGYHMRSKRRKLDENDEECTSLCKMGDTKRKNPIIYLPVEVLQLIFRFISHDELSRSVRLVNHRFKIIAEDVLNSSFRYIEKKINSLLLTTELSVAFTQDDIEKKCIIKLLNMLEILKLQYTVVFSIIWRYVFNEYYKTVKTCMYGGQLIDAHFNFFNIFLHCPSILYAQAVVKDYVLPPEVEKIIQLTKIFCVHFDKISEEANPDCLIYSGCKIIDIVDSAKYCRKSIISEHTHENIFTGEYCYNFRNSWFVALPVTTTKEMSWSQKQRMMHMRLRRIVLAHNEMFLQQAQYCRETALRPDPPVGRIKKPSCNVYTGYGDVDDIFFYYGVMNDGAYVQKFSHELTNEEDLFDENWLQDELGFTMNIKVECPLPYAPLSFLKKICWEQYTCKPHGSTHINVVFNCLGAYYPRLPKRFEYDFEPMQL